MDKSEFDDWKNSLATQEVFNGIKNMIGKMEHMIARSAGDDSKNDLIRRGYILAMEDILNIQFEETAEEVAKDD